MHRSHPLLYIYHITPEIKVQGTKNERLKNDEVVKSRKTVIPVKAGIQNLLK